MRFLRSQQELQMPVEEHFRCNNYRSKPSFLVSFIDDCSDCVQYSFSCYMCLCATLLVGASVVTKWQCNGD